jgi:hypothetical protein
MRAPPPSLLLTLTIAACADTSHPVVDDDNEVITTVELTFTPTSGGEPLVSTWRDPENDGDPVIDDVVLSDADDYALAVRFVDELAEPDDDVTDEIAVEGDEHQVFFTGAAVDGPDAVLTQAATDEDAGGLPVGLEAEVTTIGTGTGPLTLTLRHMPPENGVAVKVAGLAGQVATDGTDALPGSTDAQVSSHVTVK